jgi:hypothetical protein
MIYVFRHRVSHCIKHKIDKEKLKKEYFRRLRLVWCTEFSTKDKTEAIGSLEVAIL